MVIQEYWWRGRGRIGFPCFERVDGWFKISRRRCQFYSLRLACGIDNDPGVERVAMAATKNVTDERQPDLVFLGDRVASDCQMSFVGRLSLSERLFQRNQRISRGLYFVARQGCLSKDISLSSRFRSVAMLEGQSGSLQ